MPDCLFFEDLNVRIWRRSMDVVEENDDFVCVTADLVICITASQVPSLSTASIMSCCTEGSGSAAYIVLYIILGGAFVFLLFGCCCWFNKCYQRIGPFSGLTDAQICPVGDRCCRPSLLLITWCCRPPCVHRPIADQPTRVCHPVRSFSLTTPADDDQLFYDVTYDPPNYDEALAMPRPSEGDIVVFRCFDDTICTFKMSTDPSCDPPFYGIYPAVEPSFETSAHVDLNSVWSVAYSWWVGIRTRPLASQKQPWLQEK